MCIGAESQRKLLESSGKVRRGDARGVGRGSGETSPKHGAKAGRFGGGCLRGGQAGKEAWASLCARPVKPGSADWIHTGNLPENDDHPHMGSS